jgi:hypothetical protein
MESPARAAKNTRREFDLGQWIGRRQAFGFLAARCSAADAECLQRIRDGRLYRSHAKDWREFCEKQLHMSKSNVNRLIYLWTLYGERYFQVAQFTRISPPTYSSISGHVTDDGIAFNGEVIPFREENAARIAAAVAVLSESRIVKPPPVPGVHQQLMIAQEQGWRLVEKLRTIHEEFGNSPRLSETVTNLAGIFGKLRIDVEQSQS